MWKDLSWLICWSFGRFFSAAGATDCGFDFMGLDLCGTSFMHPWLQLSGLWAYLMAQSACNGGWAVVDGLFLTSLTQDRLCDLRSD